MKTCNINFVLAAEVAAGRKPVTTPVGTGRDENGNWYTGFIAFDKATGVPVVAEKSGGTRINWRRQ